MESQEPKTVKVATIIRVRPLLPSEISDQQSILCKDQNSLEIITFGSKKLEKVQALFGPDSTQRQVFDFASPFLSKVMEGFNVTIFTYGQTGSGKTYTMFGSDWNNILRQKSNKQQQEQSTFVRDLQQDENHAGLIPRCVQLLFDSLIAKRRKNTKVYCSFLQIYNQTMLDLLQDDQKVAKEQKLLIHENKEDGIYVEGLTQELVENFDECLQLMKKGEKNRIVRQTHMNIKSSRSHTIFQLLIEEVFPSKKSFRRMKINLCDLAGSEKIVKTEKIDSEHFEELKNINLSLTTLGKVISSLSGKDQYKPSYRDSKLTRLLQDSLGGNTYTAIIATLTTKSSCLEESLNTLKFLERAKQIKTEVVSKTFSDNPEMRNLEREISYLKDILKFKRTGANIIDLDLNDRLKRLQTENDKLKEMIDRDLVEKLKKQNNHLKKELEKKDSLSEINHMQQSKNGFGSNFKTIDHSNYRKKDDYLIQANSEGGGGKTINFTREETKRYNQNQIFSEHSKLTIPSKNEDNISTNKESTIQRGTGISIFPAIHSSKRKKNSQASSAFGSNKILDRILQIERTKQANKIKLQAELQLIQQRRSHDGAVDRRKISQGTKYSHKYK